MSVGYSASCATITTMDKLKELMPAAVEEFMAVLTEAETDLETWARCTQYEDMGDVSEANWTLIDAAWIVFQSRFEAATNIGPQCLELKEVCYRDSEDGDIYDTDETKDVFFVVGNVYHKTGAALRHENILIEALWVNFG